MLAAGHYEVHDVGDVADDLRRLAEVFPSLGCIQINELPAGEWPVLKNIPSTVLPIVAVRDENSMDLNDPEFIQFLKERGAYILFDNSGGKGKEESIERYQEKINLCLGQGIKNIALAGGFGPKSLSTYLQLCKKYENFLSIDAESRLKTNGTLDQTKTTTYFKELLNQ